MSISVALLISLSSCAFAATLEGLCAGKNVKSYFAELKFPPYSAPLWIWYIIGAAYYAIFFFVIFHLLRLENDSLLKTATIALSSS